MLIKTAPAITVTIGEIDWTPWISTLRVSEPRFEPGVPYSRSGELTIARTTEAFPVEVRHRRNQSYWRPYAQPVRVFVEDQLCVTLRILKYLWLDDEGQETGTAQLTDLLAKTDYPTDPTDYGVSDNSSWVMSMQAALEDVGLPTAGLIIPPGVTRAEADTKERRSPIEFASELAGLRGYALALAPDETPIIVPYPYRPPFPGARVRLPREGVDVFQYQDDAEVFDEARISGTIKRKRTVPSSAHSYDETYDHIGPIEFKSYASGKYASGSTTFTGLVARDRKWKINDTQEGQETWQAAGVIWTDHSFWNGSTQLILTNRNYTNNYYDQRDRLTRRETITEAAKGGKFPNELVGEQGVEIMEMEIESYTFSVEGYVKQKTVEKREAFLVGSPASTSAAAGPTTPENATVSQFSYSLGGLVTTELTIETWKRSTTFFSGKNTPFFHNTIQFERGDAPPSDTDRGRFKMGGLRLAGGTGEMVDSPPQPESRPPRREIVEEPFLTKVRTVDIVPEADEPEEGLPLRILDISEDRLSSRAEARRYGELLLALAWQRYHGRWVTMPLRSRFWMDEPFQIFHVQDQALIQEGRSLVWDGESGEAEIGWYGNHCGDIPLIPFVPALLPVDWNTPIDFPLNVPIQPIGLPAPLVPPGTAEPPFTVSFSGGTSPPAGITIVPVNMAPPGSPPRWQVQVRGEPITLTPAAPVVVVVTATAGPSAGTSVTTTITLGTSPPAAPVPVAPIAFPLPLRSRGGGRAKLTPLSSGVLFEDRLPVQGRGRLGLIPLHGSPALRMRGGGRTRLVPSQALRMRGGGGAALLPLASGAAPLPMAGGGRASLVPIAGAPVLRSRGAARLTLTPIAGAPFLRVRGGGRLDGAPIHGAPTLVSRGGGRAKLRPPQAMPMRGGGGITLALGEPLPMQGGGGLTLAPIDGGPPLAVRGGGGAILVPIDGGPVLRSRGGGRSTLVPTHGAPTLRSRGGGTIRLYLNPPTDGDQGYEWLAWLADQPDGTAQNLAMVAAVNGGEIDWGKRIAIAQYFNLY